MELIAVDSQKVNSTAKQQSGPREGISSSVSEGASPQAPGQAQVLGDLLSENRLGALGWWKGCECS